MDMKKFIFALALASFIVPGYVFADTSCATKYPVIFCHGIAENNSMFGFDGSYFYGVNAAVTAKGCNAYYDKVSCMNTKEVKASQFAQEVLEILAVTGASKINIIGHSDGCLYTRLAVSNPIYGLISADSSGKVIPSTSKVASHSSVCGVHHGSATADLAVAALNTAGLGIAVSVLASALDAFYVYLVGDSSSNGVAQAECLTRSYMNNTFNPNVPNISGVFYQSWAAQIKVYPCDATNMGSFVMGPTWLVEEATEGANDGVVAVSSAQWGQYNGVQSGAWWCFGVSHLNATGQFFGVTPGFSAPDFFVSIVQGLKSKGL
jgi:triacylglycerol lipase